MATIEEKYPITTAEESVITKDWAAGSAEQHEYNEFIIKKAPNGSYVGEYANVRFPPALWKIIDELVVNALDHVVRCLGTAHPVSCIKASIDANGRIRIYNNGPGIEVELHKDAEAKLGRKMWLPTFVFGTLFQGSNRKRAEDSIIGGTNGLGAKLTNCFSTEFAVETCDGKNYFLQRWHNNKKIEDPPHIEPVAASKLPKDRLEQHTLLSFVPDYVGLFGYESYDTNLHALMTDLIRTRLFFAAAYARYTVGTQQPNIQIWFNDEKIAITGIADIAKIFFPTSTIIKTLVIPQPTEAKTKKVYKHPWEVCAVITNSTMYDVPQISNVNGVIVRDGKHYKHVLNELVESVKEKISKVFKDKNLRFSPNYVSGSTFFFLNTKIPNPSWTGQRKDNLEIDIRKLSQYKLDAKFVTQITDKLKDQIVASIFNTKTPTKAKNDIDLDDYKPAKFSTNPKKAHLCHLLCVEGKSSMTQAVMGISAHLGWETYGVVALGGVIMNARKKCTVVSTTAGTMVKKSSQLDKNIFMNTLYSITGLSTDYKYDPKSPTYKKEMSELKYGNIIACVDQDLDGKGNILGLLLSTFQLFWPNLLAAGYIDWFCTPIIRAYFKTDKKKFSEFYNTLEYDRWTEDKTQYNIQYYKGIGTHSRDETILMFKTFRDHLFTYYVDDRTNNLFEIYFGTAADLRKVELAKPTKMPSNDLIMEQETSMRISCSDHLEYETNLYQKDNLERKLDHIIDGQNQAGRKILDGLIKALGGGKRLRVAQLSGYISEHENYHHGEESLNKSVTNRGFVAVGGKQIPIIVPESNFGTRIGGGHDAASPRYIYAHLNKQIVNILFPTIDYNLLPFNFDEGKRSEPKYFVPIIPVVICESTELPGHGWKLKKWARDVFKVIENVRRLIRHNDNVQLLRLPPTSYKGAPYEWKGDFKTIRGEPYSFGKYELSKNILTITELPLRVWTDPYIAMLKKKAKEDPHIIDEISDESNDLNIKIIVKLKPGAIDQLECYADGWYADGIEEYFQLRDHMDTHLNLMGINSEVIMYKEYESVIYEWFKVRKHFYKLRTDRMVILKRMEIRRLENIIRYVGAGFVMSKLKKAAMEEILTNATFDKIYNAKINNPKFTPNDQLEATILTGPKANFDYLLNVTDLKKSAEKIAHYNQKLIDKKQDLEDFLQVIANERFPGMTMFESELDELEKQIRIGQSTFWKYD